MKTSTFLLIGGVAAAGAVAYFATRKKKSATPGLVTWMRNPASALPWGTTYQQQGDARTFISRSVGPQVIPTPSAATIRYTQGSIGDPPTTGVNGMMGLGKAKAKGKPVAIVNMTRAQLAKYTQTLQAKQAAGTTTAAQNARLQRATNVLTKYAAKDAPPATTNPGVVQAQRPTTAPADGYRWNYNATTNAYYEEPIPIATAPATDLTQYTPGGGGGGGFTASGNPGVFPDFTPLTSTWDEGANAFTPSTAATTGQTNPLDAALEAAKTPQTAGLGGKVGMIALAGIAAYAIFKKKGPRTSARSLVA